MNQDDYIIENMHGYSILLIPFRNKTVTVTSYVSTGFKYEERENLGINHLLEHVLINSNPLCKESNCISYFNKMGILMNASTSNRVIKYYCSGLIDYFTLMMEYIITSTLDKDNISQKVIKSEKEAVINELLSLENDSNHKIINVFNKKYYSIYGLKNSSNCELQRKNLPKLNQSILKKYYSDYYTNILFVVTGDINKSNTLNLFNQYLEKRPLSYERHLSKPEFTYDSSVYFIEDKKRSNSLLVLGFPSELSTDIITVTYIDIIITYIKNHLLDILRGREKLIYGIECNSEYTESGHTVQFIINVEHKNFKKVYDKIREIIQQQYNKENFIKEYIIGIINKLQYKFYNMTINKYEKYYTQQVLYNVFHNKSNKIIPFNQYIKILDNIHNNLDDILFEKIVKTLLNLKKMLVIYSSNFEYLK